MHWISLYSPAPQHQNSPSCLLGVCLLRGSVPIVTSSGSQCSSWYASYWNAFLIPPANAGWGKVKLLHLSVSHSVHRGRVSAPLHAGIHPPANTPPGRLTPPQADEPLDRNTNLGRHPLGRPPVPPDTTGYGPKAGGNHPTGMHSCFNMFVDE